MLKLALEVTFAIAAFIGWFGIALPYLVSSRSNELVGAGFFITVFGTVLIITKLLRDYFGLQDQRKRR